MIFDPLDEIEVKMPSKTMKVNPTTELFKELERFKIRVEIK
jgi:hypothetical protein